MKKLLQVLIVTTLIILPAVSFSQDSSSGNNTQGSGMDKMAQNCPMHGMMMKMMGKSMVASGDGGVIVMVGNKLLKYDKDLNLVKETEIKMDEMSIKDKMEGASDKSAMHKKMISADSPAP